MVPRILHLHDFFFPFISGPANRMLNIIQHTFSIENHSVVTFDQNAHLPEDDQYDGVRVHRFRPYDYNELHRFLHLGSQASESIRQIVEYIRRQQPTCIALYYVGILPSLILRAVPECRVVYMPVMFRTDLFDPILRSHRAKIVLFSHTCMEDCLKAGIIQEKIAILERPIDIELFHPLEIERDPFRLLYVGRIHPGKQLPELIRAITRVFYDYPNLHLHIVGDLNPSLALRRTKQEIRRIEDTMRQLHLHDRIIFRGRCLGKELINEYSQASIHLLAGTGEMRSTATQEALAMGLQCINAYKRPFDWPEFTPEGNRLIHYVDSLEAFAPTISKLLESGSVPNHRQFIEENWSWHRWKLRYEKLFTQW